MPGSRISERVGVAASATTTSTLPEVVPVGSRLGKIPANFRQLLDRLEMRGI
jgi:hypothetical protein